MKLEVYKITNKTNGKIYVGITSQGVLQRWSKHCSDATTDSPFPIHNAIRKYGKDNFQIETIEDLSDKDYDYLKEREIYWIKEFDSYNREKGYNLTLGGDGTFGRFHSEETKDKIRQRALGRIVSKEARDKMSKAHKAREYDKKEMSDRAKKGNKIRWANKESHLKAAASAYNNRSILRCTMDGEILEEYESISAAANKIQKSRQSLSNCVRGIAKTAYGYIWKYKEENLNKQME